MQHCAAGSAARSGGVRPQQQLHQQAHALLQQQPSAQMAFIRQHQSARRQRCLCTAPHRARPSPAAAAAAAAAGDASSSGGGGSGSPSTSGRPAAAAAAAGSGGGAAALQLEYRPTPDAPGPGFIDPTLPPVQPWVRPTPPTSTPPSVRDSGTLRPAAEWYPAWMRYRQREDNHTFWQDKFSRCSLDIPEIEKRWTVFSSAWYLWQELKFIGTPPALRYLWYLVWRTLMARVYDAHKLLVLWQAKVDAGLASRATGGAVATFSRAMALRRLHWRNSLLGELLYLINVGKTGRVHLLPPVKQPPKRPTFFFLF